MRHDAVRYIADVGHGCGSCPGRDSGQVPVGAVVAEGFVGQGGGVTVGIVGEGGGGARGAEVCTGDRVRTRDRVGDRRGSETIRIVVAVGGTRCRNDAGGYVASARYRQMDGRILQRRATGPSQGKAKAALNLVLAALEASPVSATAVITSASKLSSVVAVSHLKKAAETAAAKPNCLRAQTLEEYMRLLNREVLDRKGHDRELPGLGNLRLN